MQVVWRNRKEYADRHGYTLLNGTDIVGDDRPPAWYKLKVLLQRELYLQQTRTFSVQSQHMPRGCPLYDGLVASFLQQPCLLVGPSANSKGPRPMIQPCGGDVGTPACVSMLIRELVLFIMFANPSKLSGPGMRPNGEVTPHRAQQHDCCGCIQ